MAYNAVTKKAQEFTGLQDHELFSKCFDGMGNDHVITEIIRRYIVLRDTWAAEERRMIEAQQKAKKMEAEWKDAHPFNTVRVCALSLRSGLTKAINEVNAECDDYNLRGINLFDVNGNDAGESFYLHKDEEGTYIDFEFKNF